MGSARFPPSTKEPPCHPRPPPPRTPLRPSRKRSVRFCVPCWMRCSEIFRGSPRVTPSGALMPARFAISSATSPASPPPCPRPVKRRARRPPLRSRQAPAPSCRPLFFCPAQRHPCPSVPIPMPGRAGGPHLHGPPEAKLLPHFRMPILFRYNNNNCHPLAPHPNGQMFLRSFFQKATASFPATPTRPV